MSLTNSQLSYLSQGVSSQALAQAIAPGAAEQQLIDFYVNGTAANDVTDPGYGGADNTFSTGRFASYYGPGQGPQDSAIFPSGFRTTSSGPGAISEASAHGVGTRGGAITGSVANDAYDGYGVIGFRQNGTIVLNYGGLTVTRQVDVTHGPNDKVTPITRAFTEAGVPNAARWVETVTNTTNQTITGTLGYFTNLGSDSNTAFVGSSSGDAAATTGNLYLTSRQARYGSDPVNTAVFGNNAYTLNTATMQHADGDDNPEWDYPISIAPGQTINLALFNVLTASVAYDPNDLSGDIALGGQLANLITNGGQPIAADSNAFSFFTGLSYEQLSTMINFSFTGLTIDTSRPYFVETDYAASQSTLIFDGGTLRPTAAASFGQPVTIDAAGGTLDDTNGAVTLAGAVSGSGGLTVTGGASVTLSGSSTYTGGTTLNGGTLELAALNAAGSTQNGSQTAGGVAFGSVGTTLQIDAAAFTAGSYAAPVTNFASGETIDLRGLAYAAGGMTVSYAGTTLTVTDGATTESLTDLVPAGGSIPAGYEFRTSADAAGGTNVTLAVIPAPTITAPATGTDTNNNKPAISGTGESGDTVELTIALQGGATTTGTALVANGIWTYTPTSGLPDGSYTVTAVERSPSGNGTSAVSNTDSFTVDTTSPAASSPTLTVAQNSGPTPIGIAAPSDNLTAPGSLAIAVGTLPTDGTVTLANGTPVVSGQALTAAQLTGLLFTPTATAGANSAFTYSVTDGAGNASRGTATLNVGAPTTPDALSISPLVSYRDGVFTLTGAASSVSGVRSVDIAAQVDGVATDLGAATVAADGSWTFSDVIGAHTQGFITATETNGAGGTISAQAAYSLTGGLSGGGARQDRYTADGSTVTATDVFKADGSQRADLLQPGQTFASSFFDTFQNSGAPLSTFVFDPGFGRDTIDLFRVDGTDHDTLSFKGSDYGNDIATVLASAKNTSAGLLITDPTASSPGGGPGTHDTLLLKGITKQQLAANQGDIAFHA